MENKQWFIYGTGSFAQKLTTLMEKREMTIAGYIDSNPNIKEFEGKEVIPLQQVLARFEHRYIIIASSYYAEIAQTLAEHGLSEYKDYCQGDSFIDDFHAHTVYSQYGEDILIESVMYQIDKDKTGFFIDIGAYHPYKFSNTYLFYKKGWNGINIEPTPHKAQLFEIFRPRDINLSIGISNSYTEKTFYIYDENAYNTVTKELVDERKQELNLSPREELVIQFQPMNQIISQYVPEGKQVDLLTIDVEGSEMEVLSSIDWEQTKPSIIAIEMFDTENEIAHYIVNKEYKLVAKTIGTAIFVRSELWN